MSRGIRGGGVGGAKEAKKSGKKVTKEQTERLIGGGGVNIARHETELAKHAGTSLHKCAQVQDRKKGGEREGDHGRRGAICF